MLSGSRRVTTTSGFLPDAIGCLSRTPTQNWCHAGCTVQVSLTALADTPAGGTF